jgi:hypothetical protein
LTNSDGSGLKRSYGKIKDEYNTIFSSITQPAKKLDVSSLLRPTNKEKITEMIQSVLRYQTEFVNKTYQDNEIEEYYRILKELGAETQSSLDFLERTRSVLPEKAILPYVYFISQSTPEYELNRVIWALAADTHDDNALPLYAMVATDDPSLDWTEIASELRGRVDGVVLWFSDVDELAAPVDQLIGVRKACKILKENNLKICMHSGGAYSMGLGFDGVEAVAGGLTYGERRPAELVEGGPVPQRYFVPQLLRCFPLGETRFILTKLGIDCSNPCCSGIKNVNDLIAEFFPDDETSWGPTTMTKTHYLYRFKQKINEIWQDGKDEGLQRLKEMTTQARATIPNKYFQHLDNWTQAYEADI